MARSYTIFDAPPVARTAAGLGIFEAPGEAQPAAPQLGIFDSPEGPRPAPTAPEGRPQAPRPAPTAPEGRGAPSPAPAPERPEAPQGGLGELRRDRRFKQFLREKYQAGQVRVPHPLPRLRRRYRAGVKFWTAMKYRTFRDAVVRAFEAWKGQQGEAPARERRPSPQPARPQAPAPRERAMPDDVLDRIRAAVRAGPGRGGRESTLEIDHREPADWRERDDAILDVARDGEPVGRARALGQSSANGARLQQMRLGDREQQFVTKDRSRERHDVRVGIPDLAAREQAYYGVDRLLGDGRVVPPTTADSHRAYQALVPDAQDIYEEGNMATPLWRIPTDDLVRHPDIQRITVLDAVLGHEDRHPGNVMYSWTDPESRDPSNLRFHAIDNGYSMAEGRDKRGPSSFDIRDPWMVTTNLRDARRVKDRWNVQRRILASIPEQMHEKLKEVDRDKFLHELVRSGIKDESALTGAAVRLAVLQDNPAALKPILARHRDQMGYRPSSAAQQAQREWQWLSHSAPEQLIRDYSELPASTLDDIKASVRRAVA